MVTYQLSNRQAKELMLRGATLDIALPAPYEDPDSWIRWARDSLPLHAARIVSAEPSVLRVSFDSVAKSGLSGFLGRFVQGGKEDGLLCWNVEVVICRLVPPDNQKPRSSVGLQWPGSANVDGHIWPRVDKEAPATDNQPVG